MRVTALLVPIVLLGACGAPKTFTRPAGAGTPAPDATSAWTEATNGCASVETIAPTIELAGGRVDGQRIPPLGVFAALSRAGGIRLLADYKGQTYFNLAGTGDKAQLVLYDQEPARVVVAPARAIVDALIRLDLGPVELLNVLTGCVGTEAPARQPMRYADRLALAAGEARIYLESRDGAWRVAGVDVPGLTIDYPAYDGRWPGEVILMAQPEGRASFRLRLRQHNINSPDLNPKAFDIQPVPGATAMTLDELRLAFQR